MHPTRVLLAIATFGGYVAAQSSQWTVDQSCDAANIVEACINLISPRITACTKNGNDYECLCLQYTDLATCYNNCPSDPTASSIKNTIISYCGAYSATASTSSVATATGSSTGTSIGTSAGSGATATTTGGGSSGTPTSSSATSTSTNSGTVITPGYSYGAIAGLLAFAGALL
ncbi:uncharacterized protein H6S33_009635 [Morchella sextelata]|uniref:uncharacterized protein n=1 Tax=Morchella sextelata TaxID=1174677 RepID=UPI001D055FAB|nr:uncharacterized protein H6S33_009635 [Morchella sextelata]KAH0613255.1 hypothetical protein H6S33_009635 [Morchella sextelata]